MKKSKNELKELKLRKKKEIIMADTKTQQSALLTFGGHLEVMRKMLFRVIALIFFLSIVIFCFKEDTFKFLLAPKNSDFDTFIWISKTLSKLGLDFKFDEYNVSLINTELSSQFMAHVSTSFILASLLASPYIIFELFRFISPALYDNEKKYSILFSLIIYGLFILGLLMSYYILFPISFRFLATYQVNSEVVNTITLDSYISTFVNLTFLMGIVFELPIIIFALGKMGFIDAMVLKKYRPYALVAIMTISAIITPPDIFTLILVTMPLYGLYEISILTLPNNNGNNVLKNDINTSTK